MTSAIDPLPHSAEPRRPGRSLLWLAAFVVVAFFTFMIGTNEWILPGRSFAYTDDIVKAVLGLASFVTLWKLLRSLVTKTWMAVLLLIVLLPCILIAAFLLAFLLAWS